MAKPFLFTLLCMTYVLCMAQIDENKPFVYMQNGDVIYSNNIMVTQGLFKDYLEIDNRRYEMKDIKFVNHGRGFYANTRGVFHPRQSMMAERFEKGAINMYDMRVYTTTRTSTSTTTSSKMYGFINTEYNDLLRLTHKNLEPLLNNHPESMVHFHKAQSIYKTQLVTGISGIAALSSGFGFLMYGLYKLATDDPDFETGLHVVVPSVVFVGGIGLALTSSILENPRQRRLRQSIQEYNRAHP